MEVLLVTPAYPDPDQGVYLGIQRLAEGIAGGLDHHGVEVTVATTFWGLGDFQAESSDTRSIPVHRFSDTSHRFGRLGRVGSMDFYSFGRAILTAHELLEEVDLIHSLMELGIERSVRKPIVTTHHHWGTIESPKDLLYYPGHKLIKRFAYRYAEAITVPSESSKHDLADRLWGSHAPIRVIPHGVNTEKFKPSVMRGDSSRPLRLLYAGPFEPRKRLPDLVHAVELVRSGGLDVSATLVGDGKSHDVVSDLVRERNLTGHVSLPGVVSDEELLELYRGSDLFVLPSVQEGFGQVILEAMATGTPPIVVDLPPMNHIVPFDELIVEPNNPSAIATAINKLVDDGSLATFAERCRQHAVCHDWTEIAAEYVDLYEELIE